LGKQEMISYGMIAQQYSSATFVRMRLHSRKEKFGAGSKKFYYFIVCSFLKLLKNETA
jgi:hypothetical protein